MSYSIEYRHLALAIAMTGVKELVAAETGNDEFRHHLYAERLFLFFTEVGSNNCYTKRSDARGREIEVRARSWRLASAGTMTDALRFACRQSEYALRELIRINDRDTTPEAYIRTYRQALNNAITDPTMTVNVAGLKLKVPTRGSQRSYAHPWLKIVEQEGRVTWHPKEKGEDDIQWLTIRLTPHWNQQRIAADLALVASYLEGCPNEVPEIDKIAVASFLDTCHSRAKLIAARDGERA